MIASILLAAPARANTEQCPAPIKVEEALKQLPDGWQPRTASDERYPLSVQFFDGDPAKQISLAPDADKAAGHDRLALYHFRPGSVIWIDCSYGGSLLTMTRQLPMATRECRVTYREQGPSIVNIACN